MDEQKIIHDLSQMLQAAGALNELIFRVTADGARQLVDSSGYALSWYIEPAEFTFDETIGLGTITLPSLVIAITNEEGDTEAFRLPLPWALTFVEDVKTNLRAHLHEGLNNLQIDYKNAHRIASSIRKIEVKKVSPQNLPVYDDNREVM